MSASTRCAPICIHGHKVLLPLLANFPKQRIDINPFSSVRFFENKWGQYRLRDICQSYRQEHPLLLFLDSYTVQNVSLMDLDDFEGEIYLFVGDTQHGPPEGFSKLIRIAQKKSVVKIFFVNNPQHAHWFAKSAKDFDRFYFCPIGMANYEKEETWESNYVSRSIVHVGNVLPNHKYRWSILDGLKQFESTVSSFRTLNYRAANSIHGSACASLNISLNGDLSFRLFEIVISGGLCISDELGFVQRENLAFLGLKNIVTFDSLSSLMTLIKDVAELRGKIQPFESMNLFEGHRLNSLEDLSDFSRPLIEPRGRYWIRPGGGDPEAFSEYVKTRDSCINEVHPLIEINIDSERSFDRFLYSVDLPRLKIFARCSAQYAGRVGMAISEFGLSRSVFVQPRGTA